MSTSSIDIDQLIAQAYQRGLEDAKKNGITAGTAPSSPRPRQVSLDQETSKPTSTTKRQRITIRDQEVEEETESPKSVPIPTTPTTQTSNRRSSLRAPQYSFTPGRKSLTGRKSHVPDQDDPSLNAKLLDNSTDDADKQFLIQTTSKSKFTSQSKSAQYPSTTTPQAIEQQSTQSTQTTPRKPQFRLSHRKSLNPSTHNPSPCDSFNTELPDSTATATKNPHQDDDEEGDVDPNMPSLLEIYHSPQLQHISPHVRGTPFSSTHVLQSPTVPKHSSKPTTPIPSKTNNSTAMDDTSGSQDEEEEEEEEDDDDDEVVNEDTEFLSTLEWVTRLPHDPSLPTKSSYKILILGAASSGKSSIVTRYTQNTFEKSYKSTIGADYKRKLVRLKNDQQVSLNLMDIAGQSRFSTTLSRALTRHSRAAIVVFDITRPETFEAVREWKAQINRHFFVDDDESANGGKTSSEQTQKSLQTMFPIILLMNKCDLLKKNVNQLLVMGQKLEQLKTELNFTAAFTTSAKDSLYINETFDFLTDLLYKQDIARYIEFMKTFYPQKVVQNPSGEWLMRNPAELFNVDLDGEHTNAAGLAIEGEHDIEKIIAEAHSDPRVRQNLYSKGQRSGQPTRVNLDQAVKTKSGGGCC